MYMYAPTELRLTVDSIREVRRHPPGWPRSRTQQRQRHDPDPVLAPVRPRAGVHNDSVEQTLAELTFQPVQVSDVVVLNRPRELHLDRQHSIITSVDDEVDFVAPRLCPQVVNSRLRGLREDPDAQSHQRFEQCPQQGPVTWDVYGAGITADERSDIDVEQPSDESRVCLDGASGLA